MYYDGGHTILYLTNESPAKCEILYDSTYINTPIINVVINLCTPINVEIGMMVKLNTPKINIVIKSL